MNALKVTVASHELRSLGIAESVAQESYYLEQTDEA